MKMTNRAKSALATAGLSAIESSAIAQLCAFAAQNSGMDARDYYDPHDLLSGRRSVYYQGVSAYKAEARSINADWRRFKDALAVAGAEGVTEADVIAEAPRAYSGRLSWAGGHWEYCTGQYFPTEYRQAACAVLDAAIRRVRQSRPPQKLMPTSISELKALNEKNGGCWFGRGEMRFFGTRIESGIIRGRYFITSEQPPNGARAYSVRSFDDEGSIDTVGKFCSHATKASALVAVPA